MTELDRDPCPDLLADAEVIPLGGSPGPFRLILSNLSWMVRNVLSGTCFDIALSKSSWDMSA